MAKPESWHRKNRCSFICTIRRRGKKNSAREAVKVLSIQFSVYLGASLQAAPSLACDADVLWGRQCEETEGKRDASGFVVQVSRQVTNCPSQPLPLLPSVQVSSPWYFGSETAVYYWEQNKVQQHMYQQQ